MPFFAEGARGPLITPLRVHFELKVGPDPIFDEFDGRLRAKIEAHQKAKGDTPTGHVDPALYKDLTTKDWPALFDRAVMVISSVEAHGYFTDITPDITGRDEAGITAGVIGFTAKGGSLLRVLHEIGEDEIGKEVLKTAFTAQGIGPAEQEAFKTLLALRKTKDKDEERRNQAIKLFLTKSTKEIHQRWRTFLEAVLKSPQGIAAQHKVLDEDFYQPALAAADANGITSEYGIVLAFSISVQAGSLPPFPLTAEERARRLIIASRIAEGRKRTVVQNLEVRQIGLAAGRGFPNQRFVDLTRWGFDDPDPAAPAKQRILSLAISDAPAMAALPQFELAAVANKVVEERVSETAAFLERLKHAEVPFPDFSRVWRDNLLRSENRTARARRIELLQELNELPVSCLVLGAPRIGKRTLLTRGRPVTLNAINDIVVWRTGNDLWFPLCPRIDSGLVILYGPSGVAKGDSFAHSIQQAIAKINPNPPLILGWAGLAPFPGAGIAPFAQAFFSELDAAIQLLDAPKTLGRLVATAPDKVIQAWGKACHNTFATDKTFKDLWRRGTSLKKDPRSACAALAPDKTMWRAMAQPANGVFMEKVV